MDADTLYEPSPSVADAEHWLALGAGALLLIAREAAMANVTPGGVLAEQHRTMAEPGFAKNARR